MLSPVSIALYLVTSLAILAVEFLRSKRVAVDALTLINLLYFLMYCFVPLNINILGEDAFRQRNALLAFGPGDEFHATVILVAYLLILAGYFASARGGVLNGKVSLDFGPRSVRTVSIVLLILGLVGFGVRLAEVGSIYDTLIYSAVIRVGDITIDSKFAFTWIFLGAPLAGLMLLWASQYDSRLNALSKDPPSGWNKAILVLYAILAGLCYVAASGRRDLLIVPLLMLFVHANVRNRLPVRWLVLLGLFGFVLLSYAPPLMFGLAYGDLDRTFGGDWLGPLQAAYQVTVQILGDGYIHWVGTSTVPVGKMGFFEDLANLPSKFLPSRLLGFERSRDILGDTSTLFNGIDLRGFAAPGEDEPPGFFGYFFLNLGLAGVILGAFAYGLVAGLITRLLSPSDPRKSVAWLMYWWVAFAWCGFLRDGYLEFILKERLAWWIALGLLLMHRWAGRVGRFAAIGRVQIQETLSSSNDKKPIASLE